MQKRLIKIKKNNIMLFLLLVITLIALSSCARPECKISSDCGAKKCFSLKCENEKCDYSLQSNCCGNKLPESTESGKQGSKCTCPEDYGKCEGKGKVRSGSKMQDAVYAHYYCNDNDECILGAEDKDALPQNFLDTISTGFFKASSVIKYNKPFNMGKDVFDLTISLDDAGKLLVFPIKATKIRLLFSSEGARAEMLIAELDLDDEFNEIGDEARIRVPLNLGYKPQQLEESGSVRYSIDYTYAKKVSSGKAPDGTQLYEEETVRDKFTAPSKKVFFVRNG